MGEKLEKNLLIFLIDKLLKEIEEEIKKEKEKIKKDKPYVAIIMTNVEDEPSTRYTKAKLKKLAEENIEGAGFIVDSDEKLEETIKKANENKNISSIIIQAPLGACIKKDQQYYFDLVDLKKDIDRLNSKWYYHKNENNLPLTSLGMYKLLKEIKGPSKILFYGNGLTTNKRLFLKMFDEGIFDCRIINSKTPSSSKEELIKWADIIISATGKAEILECSNKIVISPSIIKTSEGFRGDIKEECRINNIVNPVLKSIGKLTTGLLILRALKDKNQ